MASVSECKGSEFIFDDIADYHEHHRIFNCDLRRAEAKIESASALRLVNYESYWIALKPLDHIEWFWRWVFALLSVHTNWEENVRTFVHIHNLGINFTKDQLEGALRAGRGGLYTHRRDYIMGFQTKYWNHPEFWHVWPGETMHQARVRIKHETKGLGDAKTSFGLEMCYPERCTVTCLDTHMLQLYDFTKKSITPAEYRFIESHWGLYCRLQDKSPQHVRNFMFDDIQLQASTRYWSHVFESVARQEEYKAYHHVPYKPSLCCKWPLRD